MILADTSIWVDHFRFANSEMQELLRNKKIVMHPFIVGELALGSLSNRADVLNTLDELPQLIIAEAFEVRELIERRNLYSTGIGWVDAQLLACLLIDTSVQLWTTDKRLVRNAARIGLPLHPGSLPH